MSISRPKLFLVALTAAALPISASCSTDDSIASQDRTAADSPVNQQSGLDPFKVSLECSSDSEKILITNDNDNVFHIEHAKAPIKVMFTQDSSDEFINAINTSIEAIGKTEIPENAVGSARITYDQDGVGSMPSYILTISPDGTIELGNDTDSSSVAVLSEFQGQQPTTDILYFDKDSEGSFLEPGNDEWDNVPDSPVSPQSPKEVGFTKMKNGLGAFLNRSMTDTSLSAGARVAQPSTGTNCEARVGPIARDPISMTI